MASIAGKRALLQVSGASTAFTAAATTTSDDTTYTISNAVKRVWDRTATITVKNGGVVVDAVADPYTINRLRGKVVFASSATRTITLDGSYLPQTTVLKGKAYSWALTLATWDDTSFDSGGWVERGAGITDITGSIARGWTTDTFFRDAIMDATKGGVPFVIEFYLDLADAAPDMVCWAILDKHAVDAAVTGRVENALEFQGTADADGRAAA